MEIYESIHPIISFIYSFLKLKFVSISYLKVKHQYGVFKPLFYFKEIITEK